MTQECRQEMQYYKKLAIAVEKRISELKTCIDDSTICSNNIVSDTEDGFDDINLSFDIVPESDKITIPNDNSESTKCDEIDCQDDYENLNSETTIIDFNSENLHKPDIQTKDMNDLHVNDNKIHPSNGSHRNETTSDNLIDSKISTKPFSIEPPVTEDNILTKKKIDSENVKDLASTKNTMIQKAIKSVSPLKKEFQSPIIINRTYTKEKTVSVTKTKKTPPKNYKMPASKNITGSLNDISSGLSSPPKLVRQNSYTLDSPSPLLLAHLESQSQSSGIQLDSISMSDLPNIQQSSTLEKSVEHKVKQSTSSKKSNELKISLDQNGCKENTQLPITATPTIKYDNTKTESHSEQQSVKPSVKRNLFADESLLNNNISADKSSNGTTENKITELKTISKDLNESDIYLNMIMKKIRDDQEKQMMKLIKMQQEEQELLRQSFAKQQNILLTQFKTAITNAKNIGSKNSLFANSDNNNREKSLVKSNHNTENSSISPQSIENTDKYLSISLDILNESRTLLTNKREVKLSPTDIQCVNVIPSKLTESKEIKNTKNSIPVQSSEPSLYDESDISLKSGKSLNGSNIGSAYYLSDSNMNSNSSILQDDLNLSFCSDEGSHTNKSFENSKNRSSNILNDTEKAIKLKKALNKISEIQKNLASQTLAMEKRSFRNDNDISQESLHNISLSSIEYMPTYEPDQKLLDRHSLSLDLVDIHRPSSKQTRNRVGKSSKQICIEVYIDFLYYLFNILSTFGW